MTKTQANRMLSADLGAVLPQALVYLATEMKKVQRIEECVREIPSKAVD